MQFKHFVVVLWVITICRVKFTILFVYLLERVSPWYGGVSCRNFWGTFLMKADKLRFLCILQCVCGFQYVFFSKAVRFNRKRVWNICGASPFHYFSEKKLFFCPQIRKHGGAESFLLIESQWKQICRRMSLKVLQFPFVFENQSEKVTVSQCGTICSWHHPHFARILKLSNFWSYWPLFNAKIQAYSSCRCSFWRISSYFCSDNRNLLKFKHIQAVSFHFVEYSLIFAASIESF